MSESRQGFRVVIPARMASSRFPGKPLADIAGRPMIERVWRQATRSAAAEVLVATDSEEIAQCCRQFGSDVALTSANLASGTDRVAEVSALRNWGPDHVVVNVQGDAPLIPPERIDQVAALLRDDAEAALGTLCTPIDCQEDFQSENIVKVVLDEFGRALYFSRAPIPHISHAAGRDAAAVAYRHIGLYAYRIGELRRLAATPPCGIEQTEGLEQLRALWLGMTIRVAIADEPLPPDVDLPSDIERVEELLA